ncbi:MAG: hypothetical protein AAGE96_02300 [Cyanobacteria bacterium P01_G01_bin.19]
MFRKFAVVITAFIASFFLLVSPVRAESIFSNFNNNSQALNIYNTKELLNNIGAAAETLGNTMETVEDIIEVVTIGGTAICIVGSVASTTVFPPAATILPYCSAVGILDGGSTVTKVIKKPKRAWNVLSHVF